MAVSRTKRIQRVLKDFKACAVDPRAALNAIDIILNEEKLATEKKVATITVVETETRIGVKIVAKKFVRPAHMGAVVEAVRSFAVEKAAELAAKMAAE